MARKNAPKSPEKAETDPRFPSGPWRGFWMQRGIVGRQWMTPLRLHFAQGNVEGLGSDRVGDFNMRGVYDLETGKCRIIKTYLQAHTVLYEGQNENDGRWLWGIWILPGMEERGGFHLWPEGEEDPTQARLAESREVPAEELVPAGVE